MSLTLKAKAFKSFLPSTAWSTPSKSKKSVHDRVATKTVKEDDPLTELSSLSLEDFFKECNQSASLSSGPLLASFVGKLAFHVSEREVEQCFREALKVIYSPISSQLPHDYVPKQSEEFFCGKLVDALRSAFPECSPSFEQMWKDVYLDEFPPTVNSVTKEPLLITPIDYALFHLHQRKFSLVDNEERRRSDFENDKLFAKFKEIELRDIDSLIKRARSYRAKPFTLKLDLTLNNLHLNTVTKSEVSCKVRLSEGDNKVIRELKAIKTETTGTGVNISFSVGVTTILSHTMYQDLLIHVYKKHVRTTRVGEVRIPLRSLVRMFQPPDCSWGVQTYESEFDIKECTSSKSTTDLIIGTASMKMLMQMERFPPLYEYTQKNTISANSKSLSNYTKLFDLMIKRMIDINDKSKERRKATAKEKKQQQQPELLTYPQNWIIQEYCYQHGISEIYKRLSILREMVQRTDLLLQSIDEFKQSFDYVVTSIRAKHVIVTRQEMTLLRDIKDELIQKIEFVISKFPMILEGGKRQVLKILMELIEFLRTRDNIDDDVMDKKQFGERLKKLIRLALESDYDSMRQEQIESASDDNGGEICATALIKITQMMLLKIEDILFYTPAMPKYIRYDLFALNVYYDKFDTDYEAVAKKGFTGYEMLVFCRKLRELHEEILSTFEEDEMKESKVRLLDIARISKGYEEKYVLELKERLLSHMKRAIALDRWKKLNDEVLYSDSVIDFFTSANQIVSFVSELEFLSKSLVDRFAVIIGECVVEYAKALHENCIKEIVSQNEQESSTSSSQQNKVSSILNFHSFKSKLQTGTKVETVQITPQFIVKLNDIEASRQQFKQLTQELKNGSQAMYSAASKAYESESDDDEDSFLASSEEDEVSSETSSTEKTDSDNATSTESVITKSLQDTLLQLDTISDDLVSLIISQFEPFIRNGLSIVMQDLKKSTKKLESMSEEEAVDAFGQQVTKQFNSLVFEQVLNPNLDIISENIYDAAFQKILLRTFSLILRLCCEMLIPTASFGTEVSQSLDRVQIALLKHLITYASDYFYGNGEGLPKDLVAREKRFINRILKLIDMDTQRLTEIYARFASNNPPHSTVRAHHILAVINERIRYDKVAASFIKQNEQPALHLFLAHEFALEQDFNVENVSLLMSNKAQNANLKKGTFFLLASYLLWFPSSTPKKMQASEFTKNRTAIDPLSGKFKLHLKDILQMRPLNPFMAKGIKLYLQGENSTKLFLENRGTRDTLLNAIANQAKKLSVNIEILQPRKKSLTESIVPFSKKKGINGPTRVTTMPEQVFTTINPAMVSTKDIAKVLEKRFGISGANLVERYATSCSIDNSEDNTGTLYLFDTCFCFDSMDNYTIDDTDLLSSWYRVESIESNDSDASLSLKLFDGRSIRFHGFLSDFPDVSSCIHRLKTEYDKSSRQMDVKHTDPKTYYLARFQVRDDNLKMTCPCSIVTKSIFTEYGTLYIGLKNICFEKDNLTSNSNNASTVAPAPVVIPMTSIKSAQVKNWLLNGKICLQVTTTARTFKFVIKRGVKDVHDQILSTLTHLEQ